MHNQTNTHNKLARTPKYSTNLYITRTHNAPPPQVPSHHHHHHTHHLRIMAGIAKQAKAQATTITTKQTHINCKQAIIKCYSTLNPKPKHTHKQIFSNSLHCTLECLKPTNASIIFNPWEIAEESSPPSKNNFNKQSPLCLDPSNHPALCACAIRQYPQQGPCSFTPQKRPTQCGHIGTTNLKHLSPW